MTNKQNKKGQTAIFNTLGGLAITIVILTITLTVTFLVISQGKTAVTDTITATSVVQQVVVVDNASNATLNPSPIPDTTACGGIVQENDSGVVLLSGNYTCSDSGLQWVGVQTGYNATLLVNYSYKIPDGSYNSSKTLQDAVDEVPPWIPLIIIAVIGGILLSLITVFRRR